MRGWVVSPIVGTGTDLDPYRPQVMDRPAVDGDRLDIVIGLADRCLVAAEVAVNNFAQHGGLLLCLEDDFDAPFSSLPPPVRNALNRIGGTGTTIRERVRSAGLLLDPNFHEGKLLGNTAAPPTGSFVDDTFTDTDAVLLQNHTPSPTGTSWTKASYAVSDLRVTSNRIRPGGNGTLALCYATPAAAGPEQVVEAVVRVVSNPAGVAANTGISGRRSTSADDGYDCYVNKDAADVGTINMRKRVAAVSTVLATYATTLTVGADITIKLSLWDSVKRFYVNGTERGSSTDNVHTGTGRVAAFAFQGSGVGDAVGYHIDSFVATDLAAPTYPTVAGTTEGGLTAVGTSLPVTLPAGGASTDEYLVIVAKGQTACTINALTDWTELLDENTAGGLAIIRYTGAGVPSDPTFTQSASSRSVWGAYRISGADKSIAPQVGTTAIGASSVSVTAPAVTVTGGPKDVLSIICFSNTSATELADDDTLVTTFPAGYTLGQIEKTGTVAGTNLGGMLGAAARQIAAAPSEIPAVITQNAARATRAQTVIVHPAPAALNLSATGGAATASGGTVSAAATWTASAGTATAAGGAATASSAAPPVDLSATGGTATAGGGTVALARVSVSAAGAASASGGTVALSSTWVAAGGTAAAAGGTVALATSRVAAAGVATAGGGTVTLAASLVAAGGTSAATGGAATATIGAGVTVAAAGGTAAAAGGLASLSRVLLAAAGTASAGGGTATFAKAYFFTATAGTATASGSVGFAPAWVSSSGAATAGGGTLMLARQLAATAGAASASGGSVTATATAGSTVTAEAGVATAAGGTVGAAQVGALTAAGGTATTGGTVVLSTGWLSVAGTAAATGGVVSTTRALPVASGAATATGVGVTPTWVYLATTGAASGAGGAAVAFVAAPIPPGLIEAAGSAGGLLDWGGTGTAVEPGGSSTGLDGTGGVPVLVE